MLLHSVNLWNLAFYALMVFMATLGLWDVFFGFEENKCSMSYMFEYPEYQVRFCPPFVAAPRLGPLQPYPSVRFPCLGSPRLSLPLTPTASLLSWPHNTSQPPAIPFSCPLCPVFSVGSLIDGSRSIHPRPPRGCSQFLRPVRGPESRAEKGRARRPSSPETQLQSLSPNPSSQPSCLNRCSEPSFASHMPKFFPSRPVL